MFRNILTLFLAWRILLFIPLILGQLFIDHRPGYDYVFPSFFGVNLHFLLSSWANFDGIYYLIISNGGYSVDNAGFFPFFPLVIGSFASLFGSVGAFDPIRLIVSLLLVGVFLILGLNYMYKLISIDYKKTISLWSIIFLLLFPTSFFLAGIYSESLFLVLSILSFYFARKKKWILASIFGMLLAATRLVGIAILPALIYEFIKEEKKFSAKALSLLLIPLGLLSYAYYNFIEWGNAFQFAKAQGNLQNERSIDQIILLPQTLFRYFKILTTVSPSIYEWWIALLELSAFVFAAILIFIAWKKKVRTSYLIFSVLAILIPASTGTLTGIPRYVAVIFPIFIALALIKNKYIKAIYIAISLILLAILHMLFSKGYYIS